MGVADSKPVEAGAKHYVLGNDYSVDYFTSCPANMECAIFGTGCFWGSEKAFWRLPGVYSTSVGYFGGHKSSPTYSDVCSGTTGHAEVVCVVWETNTVSFYDVLNVFWRSHDPTQGDGQGGDRGSQYRSAIYVNNDDHLKIALASKKAFEPLLASRGFGGVTSDIEKSDKKYYLAEEYHQQYIAKPGNRQYCSAMPTRVDVPSMSELDLPEALKTKYASKLPESFWLTFDFSISAPNDQAKLAGENKFKIKL